MHAACVDNKIIIYSASEIFRKDFYFYHGAQLRNISLFLDNFSRENQQAQLTRKLKIFFPVFQVVLWFFMRNSKLN